MNEDHSKYIVFKRSEFYEMMGRLAMPPYFGKTYSGHQERAGDHWDCSPIAADIEAVAERTALPDAVVIRRQDIFAAPALDAYANAIQVVIETGTEDQFKALRPIADYFHEQAAKAWNEWRKVPD